MPNWRNGDCTGRDWNGDGVLAADEVLQTSDVCNGAASKDGSTTLTAVSRVSEGDQNCPAGGPGGTVVIGQNPYVTDFLRATDFMELRGDIRTKGGVGSRSGGLGCAITLFSWGRMLNRGLIDSSGGGDTTQTRVGGSAGTLYFASLGDVRNEGSLRADGASGYLAGGSAAEVDFGGLHATNTSVIRASGGNGADQGGGGQTIRIGSTQGISSNTGVCTARGGSGSRPGYSGAVIIDGIDL